MHSHCQVRIFMLLVIKIDNRFQTICACLVQRFVARVSAHAFLGHIQKSGDRLRHTHRQGAHDHSSAPPRRVALLHQAVLCQVRQLRVQVSRSLQHIRSHYRRPIDRFLSGT